MENEPHLCLQLQDGNVHVIPESVFKDIISGKMKITDIDHWEMITRAIFSEWLRGQVRNADWRKNPAIEFANLLMAYGVPSNELDWSAVARAAKECDNLAKPQEARKKDDSNQNGC